MKRNCDICKGRGIDVPAIVDTKTIMGPWAYLCPACNVALGCGIPELTTELATVDA